MPLQYERIEQEEQVATPDRIRCKPTLFAFCPGLKEGEGEGEGERFAQARQPETKRRSSSLPSGIKPTLKLALPWQVLKPKPQTPNKAEAQERGLCKRCSGVSVVLPHTPSKWVQRTAWTVLRRPLVLITAPLARQQNRTQNNARITNTAALRLAKQQTCIWYLSVVVCVRVCVCVGGGTNSGDNKRSEGDLQQQGLHTHQKKSRRTEGQGRVELTIQTEKTFNLNLSSPTSIQSSIQLSRSLRASSSFQNRLYNVLAGAQHLQRHREVPSSSSLSDSLDKFAFSPEKTLFRKANEKEPPTTSFSLHTVGVHSKEPLKVYLNR